MRVKSHLITLHFGASTHDTRDTDRQGSAQHGNTNSAAHQRSGTPQGVSVNPFQLSHRFGVRACCFYSHVLLTYSLLFTLYFTPPIHLSRRAPATAVCAGSALSAAATRHATPVRSREPGAAPGTPLASASLPSPCSPSHARHGATAHLVGLTMAFSCSARMRLSVVGWVEKADLTPFHHDPTLSLRPLPPSHVA